MIGGGVLLAIGAVVAVTDLAAARFVARRIRERAAMPPIEGGRPGPQMATVAMLYFGSVLFFLIFAALAFGLIPAPTIQPIQLH